MSCVLNLKINHRLKHSFGETLLQKVVNLSDKQLQEISSVLNLEELLDVEEKKEEQKQKAEQKMNEPK